MRREFENIFIENSQLSVPEKPENRYSLTLNGLNIERVKSSGGDFVSIELSRNIFMDDALQNAAIHAISKCLKDILKKYHINRNDHVLVIGVGNEGMTADALGAKTLKYLEVTEHFYRDGISERGKGRLSCIAGNVSGVTGINSFDIVKGVADRIKPSFIVAVDTLSTKRIARLQKMIQISDKGIVPGAGVNNAKTELSYETLGVPVAAIGVPLVIYAKNIITDYVGSYDPKLRMPDVKRANEEISSLVVTLKEIDVTVEDFARIIGRGINGAVHHRR